MNVAAKSETLISERQRMWRDAGELKEYWYVACTSAKLRRKRICAATILGLGVVVFRQSDGTVCALLDQCVHRGTALSGGKLKHNCLVCPYHGWRYDGSGRVVHIPTEDGVTTPEKPHAYAQRSFAAREAFGLVWLYLGEGDPAAIPIFDMPFWNTPEWSTYYMVSRFAGDVSGLAQNFMDVPHTIFVHDTIFRKSPAQKMRSTVDIKPASVEVLYHEEDDSIGMLPWLTNPDRLPLQHTDKFFAPNITRCDYHWGSTSGFVITSQITPIDARTSQVYTLISYKFPVPRWVARLLRPLLHAYTRAVLAQDIRIMRINRRGLDNAAEPQLKNVKADRVHIGIQRLIDACQRGKPLREKELGEHPVEFNL